MLDIKFIRENADAVKTAAKNKNLSVDIDKLLEVDKRRLDLLQQVEELYRQRNDLTEQIKAVKDSVERDSLIEKGKGIKDKSLEVEAQFKEIEQEYMSLMVLVPTVPAADVPVGASDKENVEIYTWGEKPQFSFTPRDHIELGKALNILDLERGAKVAGYRGYYLKNEGAKLVMALMMYAVNKMIAKGYEFMIPPTLIKQYALFGSGYFKSTQYDPEIDEIYKVATNDKEASGEFSGESKFLVGTAEPSLLAYYSGEVLKEEDLPLKLCGYSQCYRSEIGSYGKETKGMYRVHEFMKVEQVVLAPADIELAEKIQQEMVQISKELHEELGLPYRQLAICTGDMSAGKYRMFDMEAWLPGMDRYGETGSASNFLDWQSRRLDVRYETKDGERKFVYMLNNTALPSPRIFIAILENFQQEDGSVKIPEVLIPYTGFDVISARN